MANIKGDILKGVTLRGNLFETAKIDGSAYVGVGLRGDIDPAITASTFAGAYDAISSLVHIYEPARRTLTAYTGNLIRVRRDSDNAEMDVGYDSNGDLDTASIASWAGGATVYVVTVYDQATAGDDITQATSGAQPLYVASGQNNKPVMRLNGSSHYMSGVFTTPLTQPLTVYVVAALDATAVDDGNSNTIVDNTDSSPRFILRSVVSATPDAWGMNAGSQITGGNATSLPSLWAALGNGASSQFWINNSSQASGNAGTGGLDGLTMGAIFSASFLWDGDISCVLIVDADDTQRAAIQTAINAYWGAY